ncbi:MAG: tetratricopeptide repeat protein, partial [Nitrospirae bacterium]|nr:tetratricopeptide repeat protein [Nitrospirota bacterium]
MKLRAGHHDGFIRIVLEGPESVISTGTVKQQGQDILVNFNEANFTLQADKVSVAYIKDKNSINFTPGEFRSFKSFSLQDPGRLIIDVFDKKDVNPAQNSKPVNNPPSRQNIKAISAEDNNRKTGMPEENKTSISQSVTKVNVNVIPEKSRIQKTEGLDSGSRGNEGLEALSGEKNSKNKPVAAPESLHVASEEPAQVATQNPEHLNADKFSGNKNLAASHLASADKFYQAKDYINAIVHLNLAAVYSDSEGQRELLFLKRAELYFKAGYFYEARDNYSIFLKRFTSSKLSVNANLGLAKSLEKLGSYEEAAVYFDKSGKSAEALFGKANTLQRSGKIQEANAAYNDALLTDSAYPERLPETCYLLGENLRLSGKKEDARQYFEKIKNGLFNDSAKISLGLMAKEDLKQEEAMKYFKEASESKDRNLRAQALFNLAMISLQTGRQADALSMLQKIREKYPYTPPYKEAVLELSKLYKKDGKLNESVSVLKELVTTKNPTEAALDELQSYLMDTVKSDAAQFVKQWNELGRYLMDRSREQFLLGMAEALKGKGTPFLDLSAWLAQNGSEDAKMQTAFVLAGFFADMNETDTARKYLG